MNFHTELKIAHTEYIIIKRWKKQLYNDWFPIHPTEILGNRSRLKNVNQLACNQPFSKELLWKWEEKGSFPKVIKEKRVWHVVSAPFKLSIIYHIRGHPYSRNSVTDNHKPHHPYHHYYMLDPPYKKLLLGICM